MYFNKPMHVHTFCNTRSCSCALPICHCFMCLCVYTQGCLVVLLLQQWLVLYLTKRMMQLMTSEAFTEHRSKIPSPYLENYLAYQTHFSLSNLIRKYHSGLASKWSVYMHIQLHIVHYLHYIFTGSLHIQPPKYCVSHAHLH